MSNPIQQDQSASISAAELRRRLLSSTPPPMAASGASPQELDAAASEPVPTPRGMDALSRLKIPAGVPPAPIGQVVEPIPEPLANIRRTAASTRASGEFGGFGVPTDAGSGSGVVKMPVPRSAVPLPDSSAALSAAGSSSNLPHPEIQRLKSENKELRQLLGEMKQLLQEASDNEQQFAAKEQEFQATLAEKQRQIETLSQQLQAIEEQINSGVLTNQPAQPKTRTELEEWADELEKEQAKLDQERRRLDEERRQLREDEEALEKQMREMEVSMARERAIMARQETELKRLSAEIQHELELMQRGDPALREQMQKFQRRAQDVMQNRPGMGGPPGRR